MKKYQYMNTIRTIASSIDANGAYEYTKKNIKFYESPYNDSDFPIYEDQYPGSISWFLQPIIQNMDFMLVVFIDLIADPIEREGLWEKYQNVVFSYLYPYNTRRVVVLPSAIDMKGTFKSVLNNCLRMSEYNMYIKNVGVESFLLNSTKFSGFINTRMAEAILKDEQNIAKQQNQNDMLGMIKCSYPWIDDIRGLSDLDYSKKCCLVSEESQARLMISRLF